MIIVLRQHITSKTMTLPLLIENYCGRSTHFAASELVFCSGKIALHCFAKRYDEMCSGGASDVYRRTRTSWCVAPRRARGHQKKWEEAVVRWIEQSVDWKGVTGEVERCVFMWSLTDKRRFAQHRTFVVCSHFFAAFPPSSGLTRPDILVHLIGRSEDEELGRRRTTVSVPLAHLA